MYRHDEDSLKRLWEQVGEATETEWTVKAKNEVPVWMASGSERNLPARQSRPDIITFTITRL
jgi:hypothetical protein